MILWLPTVRLPVLKMAVGTPSVVTNLRVPSVLPPSLKVTTPVGRPRLGAGAMTVAVKLTFWPEVDGLAEETTVAAVSVLRTSTITAELVLGKKELSPE